MKTKKYRRRFEDRIEDRDPNVMWMDIGFGHIEPCGNRFAVDCGSFVVIRDADILLEARIVHLGKRIERGQRVTNTTPAWKAIVRQVLKDPKFLSNFPGYHRKFEEVIAGGYVESRWSEVVLTHRSNDGGFDVSAYKRGRLILDEAKAYKSTLLVKRPIVQAALGLLVEHKNVDQVRVTTTSRFAPTIPKQFAHLIPQMLLLRDREGLIQWLASVTKNSSERGPTNN